MFMQKVLSFLFQPRYDFRSYVNLGGNNKLLSASVVKRLLHKNIKLRTTTAIFIIFVSAFALKVVDRSNKKLTPCHYFKLFLASIIISKTFVYW